MARASNPLPIETFSSFLPTLAEHINQLAVAEQPNVGEAVASFREKIEEARTIVEALPSGDLGIAEEDEIISALRELVESKLNQLEIYKAALAQRDSKAELMVVDEVDGAKQKAVDKSDP